MATITAPRASLTAEEVCTVLRDGLGAGYNVLPGMGMGRAAGMGPHPAGPDTIVVGTGNNRVYKAEVKLIRRDGQTILRISPGGLLGDLVVNTLGTARNVRRVLASSSALR